MKFALAFKKFLKAKWFLGLFIVGIVFTIGGIMLMMSGHSNYVTTEAEITYISEGTYNAATEETEYEVHFKFTDENGVPHEINTTNFYSSGWKEGSTVKISYDPADPENCWSSASSTGILKYIGLAVGIICIVVSLVKFIIILKTPSEEMNEFNKVDMAKASDEEIEELKNNTEEMENYIFHYTTGFKPNYILKKPEGEVVYEALNMKLALFTKHQFNFVNHLTGKEEMKECTHTITTSEGSNDMSFDTESSFKMNGINCWEVLGKLGISIEPHLKDLHASFDIMKYGVKIASLEQTGTNAMTGKEYKLGNIATPGIYNVKCRESDIESIFLAAFIIARTYDNR